MIPIIVLTAIGAFMRFTNLNWDMGGRLHPDEALIVNGALAIKYFSHLFPGFHDYNGFSVYLLKNSTTIATFFLNSNVWSVTPEGATLVGRFLSALLSTLTIPLLYITANKLCNKFIALVAALFLTFMPLAIQLAHFYTTESILIFLVTLLAYTIATYWHRPTMLWRIAMGITMGLLLATKNTSYVFVPLPLIALFSKKNRFANTLLFTCVTLLTFFAGSPYSFIDASGYITRSFYLSAVVSGRLVMDWTQQFKETNGLFWIKNILVGLGPMSVTAAVTVIGYLLQKKSWKSISPMLVYTVWTTCFAIFLACTYLKFIRYSAPLIPFACILSAKLLWDTRAQTAGKIVNLIIISMQIIWGVMFFHIYLVPHTTRIAADYIARTVPPRSKIAEEQWNSIIRYNRSPLNNKPYTIMTVNMYALPDTKEKLHPIMEAVNQADYIIIESPKVQHTVARLQHVYPYTSQFYLGLQNGTLGFVQIAQFSSYPRIGTFSINDESAEETFTVFDHPTVRVYRKNH